MAACFVSSRLEKVIGRNMPTIVNIFTKYGASSWPGYRFVVLDDKVENCSLFIEHRRSFAFERKILSQLNVCVCILDRPRHYDLIKKVRSTGSRIKLIPDGDVSAVIATSIEDSGINIYIGVGGSPEGVLGAAALSCIGGKMYTKLIFENEESFERANKMGISDRNKIYTLNDLVKGDVMFSATGVTDGTFLKGVSYRNNTVKTNSVVMRSKTKTIRYVNAIHDLNIKDIKF